MDITETLPNQEELNSAKIFGARQPLRLPIAA
jgi:hypothetical protein